MVELQAELARKELVMSRNSKKNIQKGSVNTIATSKDPLEYNDYVSKNTFQKVYQFKSEF